MKWLGAILRGITSLFAQQTNEFSAANSRLMPLEYSEQVRAKCLEGRRMICGRILRVLPDGLVVESGYTELLRPPLKTSWLVPGSATVTRAPGLVEGREPGS